MTDLTTLNGDVSTIYYAPDYNGKYRLRIIHSGNGKYNPSTIDKYFQKTSISVNNQFYFYTNREYTKIPAMVKSVDTVNKGNVDWIISNNTIDTTPVVDGNSYTSAIKSSEFNTTGEYSLTLNYCEDKEYLPSTASSTIVVDSFSSTQLTDWTWAGWDETSIESDSQRDASMVEKTYTSPVTGVSETVNTCMTGKGKVVVLTHPIPVDKDYFQLSVIIKSAGSNNRVFIGNYESSNGNYVLSSDTLRVKCSDVGINDSSDTFYQMLFTFTNGVCVASGPNSTTVSKDFTNYGGDFYLMFYSAGVSTQFVSTVDWKYEI